MKSKLKIGDIVVVYQTTSDSIKPKNKLIGRTGKIDYIYPGDLIYKYSVKGLGYLYSEKEIRKATKKEIKLSKEVEVEDGI